MPKEPQIAFLVCANRSGSTFLASMLSTTRGVGMTIEGAFFATFVARLPRIENDTDADNVMRLLAADNTFADWAINRRRLHEALLNLPRPANVEAIIRCILKLYFNNPSLEYYVVKGPWLWMHVPRLRKLFRSPKFLYLVRDPRAVYNSQRWSMSFDKALPMASDPVTFCRRWRLVVNTLERERGSDFLEIRYENLLADRDRVMADICAFLHTPDRPPPVFEPGVTGGQYYERIPESQKHLHANVKAGAPVKKRAEAWHAELAEANIDIIQIMTKQEMKRMGYESITLAPSAGRWLRLAGRVCQGRWTTMRCALLRYWYYLTHVNHLRQKMTQKYYEYRRS